jgi:transaldolase
MMHNLEELRIKIFADGADLKRIEELNKNPLIKGFTTNPTHMRKSNVKDYRTFALDVIKIVKARPVSFEVFSDEFEIMEKQALRIASWGENVYVKIPITNTRGDDAGPLVRRLTRAGVKVNVTALTTTKQVENIVDYLAEDTPSCVSIFAGRIADTGSDPVPIMAEAVKLLHKKPFAELIWASPRELLNIFQAESIGCHIITVTNDVLAKIPIIGKDLNEYSLETVQMFYRDAVQAGFNIEI